MEKRQGRGWRQGKDLILIILPHLPRPPCPPCPPCPPMPHAQFLLNSQQFHIKN